MPSSTSSPSLEGGPSIRIRLDVAEQHLPPSVLQLLSLGREPPAADSPEASSVPGAAEASFSVGEFVRRVSGEEKYSGAAFLESSKAPSLSSSSVPVDPACMYTPNNTAYSHAVSLLSQLSSHLGSLLPGVSYFAELLRPSGSSRSESSSDSVAQHGMPNASASLRFRGDGSDDAGAQEDGLSSCCIEQLQQQVHRISQHVQKLHQQTQHSAGRLEASVEEADKLLDAEQVVVGALQFLRCLKRLQSEASNHKKLEALAADKENGSGRDSTESKGTNKDAPPTGATPGCFSLRELKCLQPDVLGVGDSLKCLFALQQPQLTLESVLQRMTAEVCLPLPIDSLRAAAAAAAASGSAALAAAATSPQGATSGGKGQQLTPAAADVAAYCDGSTSSSSISLVCCTPFQHQVAAWAVSGLSSLEEKLRQAFLLDKVLASSDASPFSNTTMGDWLRERGFVPSVAAELLRKVSVHLRNCCRQLTTRSRTLQQLAEHFSPQLLQQAQQEQQRQAQQEQEQQRQAQQEQEQQQQQHQEKKRSSSSSRVLQRLYKLRHCINSSNNVYPTAGDLRAFLRQMLQHLATSQVAGEPLFEQARAACDSSLALFMWLCALQIPPAAAESPSLLDDTPQHNVRMQAAAAIVSLDPAVGALRTTAAARLCLAKTYSLFSLMLQRTKQAAQKDAGGFEGSAAAALLQLKAFQEIEALKKELMQQWFLGPPLTLIYQQIFAVLPIEVQQLQQEQQRADPLRCMRRFERAVMQLKQQYLSLLPPPLRDMEAKGLCVQLLQVRRLLCLSTPHLLSEYAMLQQQQRKQQQEQLQHPLQLQQHTQQQQQQAMCASVPVLLAAIHVLQRVQQGSTLGLQQLIGLSDEQLLLSAAAYLRSLPEIRDEANASVAVASTVSVSDSVAVPFCAVVAAATTALRVGCTYTLEQQLMQQQPLGELEQLVSALGLLQQDAEKDGF
ncbi:uncharacterized protein LOC34617541 [Cyclospora cayetanensis]|uniref:Uncharacterized protein LOC34617541 n=1 Tax=Cyclospora cayetanensis TaxID=88456 RepID=A0A6P6RQ79_9EIME|nr:uncharacterized protein LOC34617541 [Cyclospora cayetanensis]